MIKSSLKIANRIYTAEGKTIEEAIGLLQPELLKGMGILVVQNGDIKKEKVFPNRTIKTLFGPVSTFNKEVMIKRISNIFE